MLLQTLNHVSQLGAAGLLVLLVSLGPSASAQQRSPRLALRPANTAVKNLESPNRPTRPADVEYAEPAVGTEVFTERYPDGKVKIEREVTLDAEGNYVNHGPWRMWAPSGQLVAEGNYEQGQRVGLWTRWHDYGDSPALGQGYFRQFKAPFLSQANYKDGVMDGEWLISDANQRRCCQITLRDGKRDGLTMFWLPNDTTLRQETYEQGVPVGDVLELDSKTGELVPTVSYLDGRRKITKKTNHPRGRQPKIEANYLAPTSVVRSPDDFWNLKFAEYEPQGTELRHGTWQEWYPNGQLQVSGQYDHDKMVGRFSYWHSNGQKSAEGRYANDKHDGLWVWWHVNGQKAVTGKFRDGALVGQWRWWSEDGHLAKQMVCDGTQTFDALAGDGKEPTKSAQSGQRVPR